MSEIAVTFRPNADATERLAALSLPNAVRDEVVPRLLALAQHHISASSMAMFLATIIRIHLPNLRATAAQLDTLIPTVIAALVAPEDARKVSDLYHLTVPDGPLPCVRPLEDGWATG